MRIEQIEIRNYRLFRDVKLTKLSPMTVIIGANGTGKSTLFDVFSFLKDALAGNVASAVARRGGFREAAPDAYGRSRSAAARSLSRHARRATQSRGMPLWP